MEQNALLPPVTYYEATLADGPTLLLKADREEYPVGRWERYFAELQDTSLPESVHAALFEVNFLAAVGHAVADYRGIDKDGVAAHFGTRPVAIARLCRALAGGRPFTQDDLDRAGITRLTPLPIEKTEEWSNHSEHRAVADAAAGVFADDAEGGAGGGR